MRFKGRVALVTGGSQGIGEAVVRRLSSDGARVAVVASSSVAKAGQVVESLGAGSKAFACDVRDPHAVRALVADVIADLGQIDFLVNSAGVFYPTPAGATEEADYDRMVDINLKGTWNLINATAPHMKSRGTGRIVNLASVAGSMGIGGYAVYCATKAAIIMLTRALAIELGPHGINVNCASPGNTATPMNAEIRTNPDLKHFLDAMAARTPSGQTYSSADDMAGLVAFLCADETRALHGSNILADEGFSAGV
jgi:3-oxoacyl-[acyl-carrier protein] reductase